MKKSSVVRGAVASPYVVWTALFIIAPLLFVVYFAFTDAGGAPTLDNIRALSTYGQNFLMSIGFSLIATAVCFVIGYPLAFCIARSSRRTRAFLTVLIMLPMWTSLLVRTYALMALLDNGGIVQRALSAMGFLGERHLNIIGSEGAVILGMIYDFLPYMVLPVYTSMIKLDNRYIEAAADLGCTPLQTIFRVVLPLTAPGILSGITMVFVPSVSTFYISQKLGGNKNWLIGDAIEYLFGAGPEYYNIASAISLILMVMILLCLAVMSRFSGDEEGSVIV